MEKEAGISHRPGGAPVRRYCSVLQAALLAVALVSVAAGLAQAQSGLAGLPLDNFQFKASHNSYQRDEDLDDQIDNYNVWCVELDLNWETDCGPCITVDHCCDLVTECGGEQRLWESIAEILRSTEIDHRVTFIWLDIKDPSSWWNRCHDTWPSDRREVIRDAMLTLGASSVYTQAEFDVDFATNGGHWPSWQDLRRRGKKFILVLEDQLDASGKDKDPVLFIAVSPPGSTVAQYPHATFVNVEGGSTAYGSPQPNDRWIYRAWNTDWGVALSRGFNLVGTDDVDNGSTVTDSRTHCPQPLYVDGASSDPDRQWGTRSYPLSGISAAVSRATAGVTIRLRAGKYAGSSVPGDKAMAVCPDPRYEGAVRIGPPQ
jgi:hypothetical protein